jgi:hypothetical protein
MKNLLQIRFLQFYREIIKAGWWAWLVILVIYVALVIKITHPSVMQPTPHELLFLFGIGVLSIHFSRKDKRLLSVIFPKKDKMYLFLEYLVFSLPLILPYILIKEFLGIILFWILCFLTAQINYSWSFGNKSTKVLLSFFTKKQYFEWYAGMRKLQYFIILLYLFCLGISYWYFSGFICLGVITFFLSEFYNEGESVFLLTIEENTAKEFLDNKLKKHLIQYLKFILPILLFYFLHYPENWLLFLTLLIVSISNFLVYILNKYKSFIPNQRLSSNSVIVGFTFIGMFVPYLFPISIILVFVFYRKSLTNLKQYFHA